MQLPAELQRSIEQECLTVPTSQLNQAARDLSESYRLKERVTMSPALRLAYAATRMPATYAAIHFALNEALRRVELSPASVLDLGAGTGSGAWALRDFFPQAAVTCLEADPALVALGSKLTPFAEWRRADVLQTALPEADIVLAAYVLGETPDPKAFFDKAWAAARQLLIIVEPGTPKAFARVAKLRSAAGHLIAPCPHANACPMETAGDWCHFAARVERSALHRRLKGGELGHEDEKFSYAVWSRTPVERAQGRIVRHPLIEPGRITLQVCETAGLHTHRVTKSTKDQFRAARKSHWGGEWGATDGRPDSPHSETPET